jgi:tetratricopeptide (TPR) repeat protein
VAVAYANALTASFQFDDWDVIVDQPRVHGLIAWWGSMPGIRPLLKFSYALNWALSSSAVSFHLANVAIHAANACLIFALLAKGTARFAALTTALIFALHPVQTEAVTYVTGRSVSLSALFVLVSLVLAGWLSSAAFASAILVKETAVMAAAPLLLRKRAIGPLVVLLGAALIAGASPWYRHLLAVSLQTRTIRENLMTQAHAVVYLMGQLVRFDRLNADPKLPEMSAWSGPLVADAAFIVGLIALGFALWKRRPAIGLPILWFFLWLLPTNSILPRLDVANDRQVYLAMAGPAWLVAYGLQSLAKKRQVLATVLVVVLCVGLATATHVRNRVYADELSFWDDVVAKAPHNPRGFNNLGYALALIDRVDEADAAFRRALSLDPGYVRAAVNLRLLREGALMRRQ